MVRRNNHLPPDHHVHDRAPKDLPLFGGRLHPPERDTGALAARRGLSADAWLERAVAFLVDHARREGTVTSDDLWGWMESDTANVPLNENHLGQAVMTAINRRLLKNTGRSIVSQKPSRKQSRIHIYEVRESASREQV